MKTVMKPLTIHQIRQVVAGSALTALPAGLPTVTAVCTDTRRMEKSSLFVALPGDRYDGHRFIPQAAAGGAIAALVERTPEQVLPNVPLIQVPDTRKALGKLARRVRADLRATVIAVAGSNGKTSTKHLIDSALCGGADDDDPSRGRKLRGSISPKSFNNDIGVPLSIFPADPAQDYLVLELGTNNPGEIAALTEIAAPDIAVITNVGAEHLEGLGDLMGVRQEEASIIKGLAEGGTLVVNGDDRDLLEAVRPYPGQRVSFGFNESNDLFASNVVCDDSGVRFNLNKSRREVFVPLLGRHTACNALAAIAVGRKMGLREGEIIENLSRAHGPEMRLQLRRTGGISVLNDAYNANPNSMKAALETVAALPASGRRIAVLGDMLELGAASDRYHRELGEFAAGCDLDYLVCVGPGGATIAAAAIAAGQPKGTVARYRDSATLSGRIRHLLQDGDLVLLKGSRGVRLEAVANAIAAPHGSAVRRSAAS
jgi:UDP-N-acetylmuramoyl-tripeptide--D-alanyl-D-alanine ligase